MKALVDLELPEFNKIVTTDEDIDNIVNKVMVGIFENAVMNLDIQNIKDNVRVKNEISKHDAKKLLFKLTEVPKDLDQLQLHPSQVWNYNKIRITRMTMIAISGTKSLAQFSQKNPR